MSTLKKVPLALISLTLAAFSCVAAPTLSRESAANVARDEGITSIWKYEIEAGQDDEVDYFLFLYSDPKPSADGACVSHRTDLDLKASGSRFNVVNRNESDYISFRPCKGLKPRDFVEISNNRHGVPAQKVAALIRDGLPGFGGTPIQIEAATASIRQCLDVASEANLSDIVVYSETEVSGIFSPRRGCQQRFEIMLQRSTDGGVKAIIREALSPYIIEKKDRKS